MKKLLLSVAVILGGLSANAKEVAKIDLKPLAIIVQDEYKEVDAVPAAIKTALDNAYPGVKMDRAYVNANKEYKIEIIVRDVKSTVYTDAQGNFIKK
jgi:hypothetical protein